MRPRIVYKEEQNMKDTNKEQAMKELEQLKKEFDERTKKLEEIINQKESVVWKPKEFNTYLYINSVGEISYDTWTNYGADENRYNIGNCYKTDQEARDARDAQIILTRLQRLADEMNGEKLRYMDWEKKEVYISVVGCLGLITIRTRQWSEICTNACFKTEESAQKALDIVVKNFGTDKVKMALSGVWR